MDAAPQDRNPLDRLGGNGRIIFDPASYPHSIGAGVNVIIGEGITLEAHSLNLGAAIHSFGTILADQPGDLLQFAGAFTNSGTIRIGSSLLVTNSGHFAQTTSGKLVMLASGTQPGVSYPQLKNSPFPNRGAYASMSLNGTLVLETVSPFQPRAGDIFELLQYPSRPVISFPPAREGMFASHVAPTPPPGLEWLAEYGATSFLLKLGDPLPPPPPPPDPNNPAGALDFDGVDDAVQVAHADTLNAFPLTIAAWVRTTQNSPGYVAVANKYVAGSGNGYSLHIHNGRLAAFYFRGDGASYVYAGDPGLDGGFIADGDWHHVAYVVDASGGRIYVDGVQTGSLGWTGAPGACTTTTPILFGTYPLRGQTLSLEGQLDEVILFNKALTAEEINDYKARRVSAADDDTIIGLWHFDEKNGTTATDASGNGHTATFHNGTQWIDSSVP